MEYYTKLKENNFAFTAVDNFRGGGYIMNDGLFLSLNNDKEKFIDKVANKLGGLHSVFDRYLRTLEFPRGECTSRLLKATDDNAIAINDGTNYDWESPYIDLPKKALTEEQFTALTAFLDKIMLSIKKKVVVENKNVYSPEHKTGAFKEFNLEESLPEDVLAYIRSLYN